MEEIITILKAKEKKLNEILKDGNKNPHFLEKEDIERIRINNALMKELDKILLVHSKKNKKIF